jgi:hypothetical protein
MSGAQAAIAQELARQEGIEMTADLIERAALPAAPVEQPVAPAGSMLAIIARAASDPTVDVGKMQALLEMQRQLEADQARAAFNAAFARVAAQMPRIKKKGAIEHPANRNQPDGPKRKISSYARLEDIDAAIRPLLDAEGFALSFDTAPRTGEGGGLIVTATLLHEAGHSRSASIPVPLDTSGAKNNIQGYGSALSYGRRYSLCAVLNIVTEGEDDDGVRGGIEFIDAPAVKQLDDLLRRTRSNFDDFCRVMGVRSLVDIQVQDYPRAVNAVMAKLVRQGETHENP